MKTKTKVLGWASVILPALVLSCQNPIGGTIGGTTSSGGDKTNGPTVSDNSTTGVKGTTGAPAAPAASGAVAGPDEPAAPPSEATLTAVQEARDKITPMMGVDSKVVFVNCAEGSCTARVEAGTLAQMRNALQGVSSAYQGRVSFEVREHFDAYAGHSYHADLVLGTNTPTAVPTDENVLMGVN